MGKRYQAILNYIDVDFLTFDNKFQSDLSLEDVTDSATGIIIATPTETHFDYIVSLAALEIPILCEKPLTKEKEQLAHLKTIVKDRHLNLTMMMQYKMLDDPSSVGDSHYNYFKSGNDGLVWDCMQIIGLARGHVSVSNGSPIWDCRLNGKNLKLSEMDLAYVNFVKDWLKYPGDDISKLIDIHQKVMAF